MCGTKGMTTDATKPCERCKTEISAFPATKRYCVNCRRAVTIEQQAAHTELRRSRIPPTYSGSCKMCGASFEYPSGRGYRRFYCSHLCSRRGARAAYKTRLDAAGKCSVDGCDNKIHRVKYRLCENHYCLQRRNGAPVRKWTVRHRHVTGMGYVKLTRPDHPIADSAGQVFEHRAVAYEKHGGACPDCFWCGCGLEWGEAVVDHLNEVKHDNAPDNLAVCCNKCNRARGSILPFISRMKPERMGTFVQLANEYKRTSKGE
jgi:hypothetical protein